MRKKILLLLVIMLTVQGAFFTIVYADDVDISKYTIHAQINKDGSMDVEEILTYDFGGSFNGARWTINLDENLPMENIKVFLSSQIEPNQVDEETLIPFKFVDQAQKGDDGVVKLEDYGGKKEIWIYSPSKGEKKTFVISYTLKHVIKSYEDTAELYWKFVGEGWDLPIHNVDISINLPKATSEDYIKIFGHGPLTGESKIVNDKTVALFATDVKPGQFVEARLLFPTGLVSDVENVIPEKAYDSIMEEEARWANEANAERETHRRRLIITNIIVIVFILSNVIIFIYLYTKYDREFRPKQDIKYYRELPGDYSPAEMSVLYNFGSINTRDVTATLMDLVRRGYLKIETYKVEKRGLLKNKQEEEYRFVKIKDADNGIIPHEAYLLKWFIDSIGDGTSVTLKAIENYPKSASKAQKFKNKYDVWTQMVKDEAKERGFFDDSIKMAKAKGAIFAFVESIIGFIIMQMGNLNAVLMLIAGIILFIYSIMFKRRSHYGTGQFYLWKAFRRFLLDFSNMKEHTIPSIVIWEHYLVYAISLGVAKEVIKQLKLVIPPEEFANPSLTYLYMSNLNHQYIWMDRMDHMTGTFDRTINAAIAESVKSSASGTGGGFSGGGGGGGGGTGGGAF